ncbi:MAG: hypothetical protein KJN60_03495 [Boseongicola sp.]|nr:hypothetical protein [Boseongicola sp.]
MLDYLVINARGLAARFHKDEDGIALTEYLILLGLLAAAVILAVIFFGAQLATVWNEWGDWIATNLNAPDDIT